MLVSLDNIYGALRTEQVMLFPRRLSFRNLSISARAAPPNANSNEEENHSRPW